ncbi:MAG TPA: hypothetical protein PLO37_25030 [Candidatus Hydrogenedentes bacterium]|nr:hypothetical protein [Candidatus Hydrogenedentota bacterium]HPG70125.1 hypothetical protein [Candidatus Hydrogenedentota bacterium]
MNYYVTTGKSLSDASRCWQFLADVPQHDGFRSMIAADIATLEGWDYRQQCRERVRTHLLDAMGGDASRYEENARQLVEEHLAPDAAEDRNLYHLFPAEIATLMYMNEQEFVTEGGQVTFLIGAEDDRNSNIKEGWLCVALLGRIMKLREFPTMEIETLHCKWHPENRGFEGEMERLVENFAPKFQLVLTGGFKGVILSIAAKVGNRATADPQWAAFLRQNWRPNAYYIQEDHRPGNLGGFGVVRIGLV